MTDTDKNVPDLPTLIETAKQAIVKKKPAPKKARRKGKKSIPFDRDPEILARLATVAEMMLVGARPFQISTSIGYSLKTANRDVIRVKQIWSDEAKDEIDNSRNAALAQYRLVIMRAWDEYGKKTNENRKDRFLALITATQKEIDRIQGIGPMKIDLSGKLELTEDIEKVRQRRWDAIKPQVAEMLTQAGTVRA